ncbi:MAG: MerR family transcriptional regulator [Anaerolineae bacterium]|nr:MerR family transcriptional regulator [Anaerolineae bacterium]
MANVGEVRKLIGTSADTLRRWCDDDHFAMFLSPGATPPKGDERFFNAHDLRVLNYISTARKSHAGIEDIRKRLSRMKDSGWAGLPDVPDSWKRATGGEVAVTEVTELLTHTAELATLQTQVGYLRDERDNAVERAETVRRELDTMRADASASQSRVHALEVELAESQGRVSTLEARLQQYAITGGDQPLPVGAIIVSALVAGAVLVAAALVLARLLL